MWTHGCIGDVLSLIQNGVNCKQDKSGVGDKVSRIETIADSNINYDRTGYAVLDEKQKAKALLHEGDILFSHINSPVHVGKTAIYDGVEPLYHGINLLRLQTIDTVDSRYFNMFLISLFQSGYWKRTSKQSVNQASVNQTDIKQIPFSYPPLAEQQRIVTNLDAAFAEIDRAIKMVEAKEAEIDKLKASLLTASLKDDAGMWRMVKLGDACEILDSLRKPITKKFRAEGDVPYYGATGIVDWVADYIFDEKLVLVGEDGAKWGSGDKTAFVVEGKTWVNNHAHVLRPRAELVTHEWIAYYLTSINLSPWVTGLTVPKLNQAQLRSIPIPLPPIAEQQHIVAKLNAAFAEIDTANASIASKRSNYSALKSVILAQELNPSEAA